MRQSRARALCQGETRVLKVLECRWLDSHGRRLLACNVHRVFDFCFLVFTQMKDHVGQWVFGMSNIYLARHLAIAETLKYLSLSLSLSVCLSLCLCLSLSLSLPPSPETCYSEHFPTFFASQKPFKQDFPW